SERRDFFATRRRQFAATQPSPQARRTESAEVTPPAPPAAQTVPPQEVERLRRELAGMQDALEDSRRTLRDVQETLMLDDLSEGSLSALLELATRDIPDQSAIDALLEDN